MSYITNKYLNQTFSYYGLEEKLKILENLVSVYIINLHLLSTKEVINTHKYIHTQTHIRTTNKRTRPSVGKQLLNIMKAKIIHTLKNFMKIFTIIWNSLSNFFYFSIDRGQITYPSYREASLKHNHTHRNTKPETYIDKQNHKGK